MLDRACASNTWINSCPEIVVSHLSTVYSDHCPILLETNLPNQITSSGRPPFRFEAAWAGMEECDKLIKRRWASQCLNGSSNSLLDRLRTCNEEMNLWNKRVKGKSFQKQIEKLEDRVKKLRSETIDMQSRTEEAWLLATIGELVLREERYWKQRRKKHWLKLGDRNTSFFHATTTERRRSNRISKLTSPNQEIITDNAEIKRLISQHFHEVYQSSHPS
ncbi:UNVERIFIED_CONTAM: hypothetical protein Slati_1943500 [Sesamum latifolium]|uniref:Endonuclease/exonuclease/phosphatase n=1 Tax=Sesamum latifolium TaxID=2727402 RepID=A0AAW2X5D8_9LAMI